MRYTIPSCDPNRESKPSSSAWTFLEIYYECGRMHSTRMFGNTYFTILPSPGPLVYGCCAIGHAILTRHCTYEPMLRRVLRRCEGIDRSIRNGEHALDASHAEHRRSGELLVSGGLTQWAGASFVSMQIPFGI